ncbi:MAG: hypothetical protein Crog4KO_25560 [Crocinitomicaceae bacterium]
MFTNSKHKAAHEALKKGEIEKAILLYTEALRQAPNDCDILGDRATAFLHKKDKLRCLADFDKAVSLDPNYAYRYASRAFAKQNFGDIDAAVADYQKAVDLDPEDAVAQNNLGMLLEQQGYKKEADERFARADKLSKMEDQLYEVMDDLEDDQESGLEEEGLREEQPREDGLQEPQSYEEDLKAEFDARAAKAAQDSGASAPEEEGAKDDSGLQAPQTSDAKESDDTNTSKELKKVFTSRQQFREFVRFIKNGFKLK